MRNRKPNQHISLKYFLTRKKYNNLHKRITDLIKEGGFYELSEKIRKNLLRRLNLLYKRLLRLLSIAKLSTAALTVSFLLLSNTLEAQTFTNQTGTNNPFNGVDVGANSSLSFVDIDGDGDIDAFIGESVGTIKYYKNTGTALTPTFAEQTGINNPFNSVDVGVNATPSFLDVDGDGDMDAFIGESGGSIKYYKNTGTTLAPTFTVQTGTNNPFNGVDVGVVSAPNFVDVDGDGDMDAFIGEQIGNINYYKNTGTALAPSFTEQTGTNNPFNGVDVGGYSKPSFIDLDSDGDMDVFIGEGGGTIIYYKNTGTALSPTFTNQTGTNNPFNGVDVGNTSDPSFVDIDSDGDMDAFIGENLGNINYYKNTSSLHTASFAQNTGNNDPFDGVDIGAAAGPSFIDIDGDGDFDAFTGEYAGVVLYYKNTGTVLAPTFTNQTGTNNPFNGVDIGVRAKINFLDIDGDGDMDAFIGEFDGVINYYKNTGTVLSPTFTPQTGTNNPFNGVDVGQISMPVFVDIDGDGDMDSFIGESAGAIFYYKNTGTALAPTFTPQTGTNNPLNGVGVGSYSIPSFADIDGDGDMDSFIGEFNGTILYYKNTGTPLVPNFTNQTGTNNLFNGVDVGDFSNPSFADLDSDGDMDAFIGEFLGTIKTYADGTNALPVELTTFSASVSENGVTLLWNTATEVNNYGFEIERSNPPLNPLPGGEVKGWVKIGFIAGNGTSNIPHNYAFIDENILGGIKFNYRLKQVDVDGKFEYSDVLTVTVNTPKSAELMQNSPNPFNPSTSIKFFIPTDADVTIKIYDLIGREVQILIQEQTKAGFHIVFWNGRNSRGRLSASGVYFYRLTTNSGFVQTKKMALLK